jgi:hypothetical protein
MLLGQVLKISYEYQSLFQYKVSDPEMKQQQKKHFTINTSLHSRPPTLIAAALTRSIVLIPIS